MALAAAGIWRDPGATGQGASLAGVAVAAIVGLGAALYRPAGWPSLAMGACVLPPAIVLLGTHAAALTAILVLAGRQAIAWLVERDAGEPASADTGALDFLLNLLLGVGPLALAVLAAAWVGSGAAGGLAPAGIVYLGVFAGLTVLTRSGAEPFPGRRHPAARSLRPFLLDAVGWLCGLVLLPVVTQLGWPSGAILGSGLAVLSGAALAAQRRALQERRISNRLRDVHLAGHRIIFRQPDLQNIAAQICSECRGVAPFSWFHLELRDPDGRSRHWRSGPAGGVERGRPEPPPAPPRRRALGRRQDWKIVTRELSTGERILGRMRLWCDPRTVGDGEVDWLDAFLPEVASAIERAFLNREARRDPLTGLPDRRVLESRLEDGYRRALALGSPMAVIMADLDHFKEINDRHGHAVGDRALVEVTRLLEEYRREADVCCRYGGEEFALVLEDADGETALAVAERIRLAVESASFAADGKRIPLRLSAGVASFPGFPVRESGRLVELADEALYEAKRRGRNRSLLHFAAGRFRDPAGKVDGLGLTAPVAHGAVAAR